MNRGAWHFFLLFTFLVPPPAWALLPSIPLHPSAKADTKIQERTLTPEQLAQYRVTVNPDGKLFYRDQALTSTAKVPYIYVLSPAGILYIAPPDEVDHHSDFLGGANVVAAGEITISGGIIDSISNKSGHYRPDQKQLEIAVNYLREKNVAVVSEGIQTYSQEEMPSIKRSRDTQIQLSSSSTQSSSSSKKLKLLSESSTENRVSSDLKPLSEEAFQKILERGLPFLAPTLPGISDYHLIWIGSPLRENQYDFINTICRKITESHKDSTPTLTLWVDLSLLAPSNPNPLIRRKLNQCPDSLFKVQEVNTLFSDSSDDSNAVITEFQNLSSHLHSFENSHRPCVHHLPSTPQFNFHSQNASPLISTSSPPPDRIPNETRKSYEFLKAQRELGGKRFAPMADILRILILRQHGGIYFDLNKDFSNLFFRSSEKLTEEKVLSSDLLVRAELTGKGVKFHLPESSLTLNKREDAFLNNDFIGAPHPKAKFLDDFLNEINTKYKTLQNNLVLRVFLTEPATAPSIIWVFSIAGPVGFNQSLNTHTMNLLKVYPETKYLGEDSWSSNLDNMLGVVFYLHNLRKAASVVNNNDLNKTVNKCWDEISTQDEKQKKTLRSPYETQNCFFNYLTELITKKRLSDTELSYLNESFGNYRERENRFRTEVEEACKDLLSKKHKLPPSAILMKSIESSDLVTITCNALDTRKMRGSEYGALDKHLTATLGVDKLPSAQ